MAEEGRDGIRIVRGAPTAEELAAIVGVLLLRPTPAAAGRSEPAGSIRWAASARPAYWLRDGRPARRGPTGWRASAQPR